MAVTVAEYLGQSVSGPVIAPATAGGSHLCPFMNGLCIKAAKGTPAVCSVRGSNGQLWMTCEHRLCSTTGFRNASLHNHQQRILRDLARILFGDPKLLASDVLIKSEVRIEGRNADGIMTTKSVVNAPTRTDRVLIEFQGGGDLSQPGPLNKVISTWEAAWKSRGSLPDNSLLARPATSKSGSTTSTTHQNYANVWKRQLEQLIVKGRSTTQTANNCRYALCVGADLFDYIDSQANIRGLKHRKNWKIAFIGFSDTVVPGQPLRLDVDQSRLVFTDLLTFLSYLAAGGEEAPDAFAGNFISLNNVPFVVPPV